MSNPSLALDGHQAGQAHVHLDYPPPVTLHRPNLALIGFSTTGKSTVARLLATALGWYWADTDELIVATAGRPIHAIFSHEGEAAFRARESAILAAALAGDQTVIATGGGIVTVAANRDRLRERARVICLTAAPEIIVARLRVAARHEPRPLLDAPDPLQRIQELLAQRQTVYSLADFTVETDNLTPFQVVEAILEWLDYSLTPSPSPTQGGGGEGQDRCRPLHIATF